MPSPVDSSFPVGSSEANHADADLIVHGSFAHVRRYQMDRDPLVSCVEAALAGGREIASGKMNAIVEKEVGTLGNRNISSNLDLASQKRVLDVIERLDPSAYAITEELVQGGPFSGRIIQPGKLNLIRADSVYIIDELDGTASRENSHPEWSVSVGNYSQLQPKAGAVFAPGIGVNVKHGGTLFFASKDEGVFEATREGKLPVVMKNTAHLKDAYVLFGVDCLRSKFPRHTQLEVAMGAIAGTINHCGSCALGLAFVASGRADVFIQPLQAVWDWAAGRILVEEAGGVMIFYEMDDTQGIARISELELKHFDPSKKAVGFVAGPRHLAEATYEMLQKTRVSG